MLAAMQRSAHANHCGIVSSAVVARWSHSKRLAQVTVQQAVSRLPPAPTSACPPGKHSLSAQASASAAAAHQDTTNMGSKRPWQQRIPYECPCCGQNCYRVNVLHEHLSRCCPDLVAAERTWPADSTEGSLRAWLGRLQQRELVLREAALEIAFRQVDAEGNRLRQGSKEVGAALGLPPARAQLLLQAAMRAVPLAADVEHPIEIIYEDEDLIALNKPPGVISAPKHRYTGGSMVNRVIGRRGFEPLTLHRLDQWTSGVLLFAKSRDVVPRIHEQFRERTVEKQYIALAVGVPQEQQFSVDAPLGRDERDKVARKVRADGKPALTDFHVLAAAPSADLSGAQAAPYALPSLQAGALGVSLIGCKPHTGRTHQIRVHLAHTGHAILGDDLYGLTGPWLGRQALHAATLQLEHPRTQRELTITAPLPQDIVSACKQLALDCTSAQSTAAVPSLWA